MTSGTLHAQDCIISRNGASIVSCFQKDSEPLRNSLTPVEFISLALHRPHGRVLIRTRPMESADMRFIVHSVLTYANMHLMDPVTMEG